MRRHIVVLVSTLVLQQRLVSAQALPAVTGSDSSVLSLAGRQWKPGLVDIRVHGALRGARGSYYLVSGFECTDCDAPRQLELLAWGQSTDSTKQRYYYPGAVHGEEGESFIRSRAFLGSCGADSVPTLLIVQSVKDSLAHWHNGSIVVQLTSAGRPAVRRTPGRATAERLAVRRVSEGACREVPAIATQIDG